jgi:MFS transporter, DHA2 family, multidrug resistance protein
MDLPGALLSITGLFALLYGIIEAPTHSLGDAHILLTLGAAVVLLAGFVIWERHTTTPLLNLTIFRNPAISAAIVALTLASLGMTGGLFFLTQYLQLALNYTPMGAGLSFTPFVLGLLVTSVGLSPLLDRLIGTKLTVSAGLFLSAGSILGLSTLDMHTSFIAIAGMLAL